MEGKGNMERKEGEEWELQKWGMTREKEASRQERRTTADVDQEDIKKKEEMGREQLQRAGEEEQ